MTALTVTSDDLASFLGETVDDDRAEFILDLVMSEAGSIVDPVPDGAKGVILGASARLYGNPLSVTQELVGPYQYSRPFANLLTKSERSSLRRHAGGGGAFYIDPLGIDGTGSETTDYPGSRFPTS